MNQTKLVNKDTQQPSSNSAAEFTCLAFIIVSAILIGTLGFFSGFRWLAVILGMVGYLRFWALVTEVAKRFNLDNLAREYFLAISTILCIILSFKLNSFNWIPLIALILIFMFGDRWGPRFHLSIIIGVLGILFSIVGWQNLPAYRILLIAIALFAPIYFVLQKGSLRLRIFTRLIMGFLVSLVGLILIYVDSEYFILQVFMGASGAAIMYGSIPFNRRKLVPVVRNALTASHGISY